MGEIDLSRYYDEKGILNTDELAFLANSNPAMFMVVRLALIQDCINQASPEKQQFLTEFQEELDAEMFKKEPGQERVSFLAKLLAEKTKILEKLSIGVAKDFKEIKEETEKEHE